MATAKVETLLALDDFAHLMTIHPLHFNQVYLDEVALCGTVWLQYGWQSENCASREEVALAIRSAEDDLENFLGFPVAPKWFEDQIIHLEHNQLGRIVLPKAHYITGGKRRTSLIQAGATITYAAIDANNANYSDTATVTITTAEDINEIAVVYPGQNFDDWRIRGVTVTRSGADVTITIKRHKLVKLELLEKYHPESVIGTEADKFLSTVDVYRVYNDPATQLLFQGANHCCGCVSCSTCSGCGFTVDPGCIRGYDPEEGIVDIVPAEWDTDHFTSITLQAAPYLVKAHFRAGWPLVRGEMDTTWSLAVSRLALTRINNPLCPCPSVQQKMEWWTTDLGTNTAGAAHRIPVELKNCPWGYTRGALYAYSIANKHRKRQGLV